MRYAFLRGLEVSETVGRGTGWMPLYLLVTTDFDQDAHRAALKASAATDPQASPLPVGTQILGAAPAYVKTDSYGEFIFDWAWASFFHRNGVPYYPKLVVAAPFTPATGPRLLVDPDCGDDVRPQIRQLLGEGMIGLAGQLNASSVHWLFTRESEAKALRGHGYRHRLTVQHAWVNEGYADFDAFLATMKSRKRKAIRRERRLANDHGLEIGIYRGSEMDDGQWRAVLRFYHRGCERYGSTPYLTEAFFGWLRSDFADYVLCCMARDPAAGDDGQWVASTLNFQCGDNLYGRYWGCEREWYALHFEMAFYRLIEHCIAQGWQRFEAGAGGRHKLQRGLQPVLTHSAHWVAQPQLAEAIYGHIDAESQHVEQHRHELEAVSTRKNIDHLEPGAVDGGSDPPT